jgi:hypothetical protein
MKGILLLVFNLFCLQIIIFAQGSSIGKVSISSPNAASLGKYADYPISYHTGTPQIEIPIYTVKSGQISLPISVSYHASGLKVLDQASCVGAGWALNAGGVITRTVMGAPDDRGMNASHTQYGHYHDYGYNSYLFTLGNGACGGTGPPCPIGASHPADDAATAAGTKDGEPDLYLFNFGGYSGKFYFRDDRTPILLPEQDLKIEPILADESQFTALIFMLGFIITTPDGTKYYFGKNQNSDGNIDAIEISSTITTASPSSANQEPVSSWFLNKIVSADGQFSITLVYKAEKFSYYSLSMFPIWNINNDANFGNSYGTHEYDLAKNFINGVRLSQIIFPNGTVDFTKGNIRTDLGDYTGDYTNQVLADVANASVASLGSISINDNVNSFCKTYNFSYSYFYDGTSPMNGFVPTSFPQFANIESDKYRLRLDKIQETSCDNSVSVPPYQFSYYTQTNSYSIIGTPSFAPRKLTFGQDHWGYYNGITNNNSLVPTYILNKAVVSGADRESHWPAMACGTLHQITYPTGGNTIFDFESNDTYGSQTTYSVPSKLNMTAGYSQTTLSSTNNYTFTNDSYQVVMSNTNTTGIGQFKILDANNNEIKGYDVQQAPTGGTSNYTSEWFILTPGNYTVKLSTSNLDQNGHGVSATLNEYLPTTTTGNIAVGGLRIKTITNTDGLNLNNFNSLNNKVVTNYSYTTGGTQSSGVLYSRPTYVSVIRNEVAKSTGGSPSTSICSQNGCATCDGSSNYTYYKSGGSILPMQTVQGNHIGYGQVTVSQANNGYSIYGYYQSGINGPINGDIVNRVLDNTSCDAAFLNFPAAPVPFEFKRGELQYEKHFNVADRVLKEVDYLPVYTDDPTTATPGYMVFQSGGAINALWGTEYTLQSKYKSSMQITTTDFDPVANTAISKTQTSYYNSPYHHHVTQTDINTSTGAMLTIKTKYAFDFRITACDNLSDGSQTYNTAITGATTKYTNSQSCTSSGWNCHWIAYQQLRFDKSQARIAYVGTRKTNFTNPTNQFQTNHNTAKASANADLSPILEMQDEYINDGIETTTWKNNQLIAATFNKYFRTTSGFVYPNVVQNVNLAAPSATFTNAAVSGNGLNKDVGYVDETTVNFNTGNIHDVTDKSGITSTYIWDYNNALPVAKITGVSGIVAYTSFEADGSGNWSIPSNTRNSKFSVTGNKSYSLTNGSITIAVQSSSRYVISCWAQGVPLITGAAQTFTGNSYNGFTYYEFLTNATVSNITINGSFLIDELRLYPVGSQMTTYTYSPLLGISSQCDVNNKVSYYDYDALGRLHDIRDFDRNIIKQYCYDYQGQPAKCGVFSNSTQSKTFAKNDCTQTDYSGSEVMDTVMEATYFSDSSQAVADSLAVADLNTNGQLKANLNGSCLPMLSFLLTNYEHIAGFIITLTAVYDSTKIYAIVLPENSDSAMSIQKVPQGHYNINISKPANTDSYVFIVSGPNGDIEVNSAQANWVNVPVNPNTFNKISIATQ